MYRVVILHIIDIAVTVKNNQELKESAALIAGIRSLIIKKEKGHNSPTPKPYKQKKEHDFPVVCGLGIK
jgi:hypothetical protein